AFRYMAQSRQTGKVLVTFAAPEIDVEVPDEQLVRPDASYLITGGLSGIGLRCAQWLTFRGAQRLVLAGRRAPAADAQAAIERLRETGVEVAVVRADVGNPEQVRALVAECQAGGRMPLAGVIHAAGVLHDGVIANLTWDQVETVLTPKVYGTANLMTALDGVELDFLVLFSSLASTLASPGQASYVAANSYLD